MIVADLNLVYLHLELSIKQLELVCQSLDIFSASSLDASPFDQMISSYEVLRARFLLHHLNYRTVVSEIYDRNPFFLA